MSAREKFTSSAPHGSFIVVDSPDAVDVTLRGEFDVSSTDASRKVIEHIGELLGAAARPVRIEMSAVSFFDAAGIRFLLQSEGIANLAGTTSTVQNPSSDVRRLLDLLDLHRMLDDA